MAAVSSQREGAPPEATWNTLIWVEDADEAAAKTRGAGGSVLNEPFEVMEPFADGEGLLALLRQATRTWGACTASDDEAHLRES